VTEKIMNKKTKFSFVIGCCSSFQHCKKL
jgi:hypothetical protein